LTEVRKQRADDGWQTTEVRRQRRVAAEKVRKVAATFACIPLFIKRGSREIDDILAIDNYQRTEGL
jgi:hypothetical protein